MSRGIEQLPLAELRKAEPGGLWASRGVAVRPRFELHPSGFPVSWVSFLKGDPQKNGSWPHLLSTTNLCCFNLLKGNYSLQKRIQKGEPSYCLFFLRRESIKTKREKRENHHVVFLGESLKHISPMYASWCSLQPRHL